MKEGIALIVIAFMETYATVIPMRKVKGKLQL